MDDSVREGFICPICHRELDSLAGLQGHFETAHSNEDKDGLKAVKGLFGRAKRRLLGDILPSGNGAAAVASQETSRLRSSSEASGIDPVLWEPQEFGVARDHFQQFKRLREDNVKRTIIETNKKVIRLEKLHDGVMKNRVEFKSDSKKRKNFEQSVVTWMADSMALSCPFCKGGFNVRRRKHHCRLCGQIICKDCSEYISLPFAESLTKSAKGESQKAPVGEEVEPDPKSDIRSCFACYGLLLRRSQRLQDKYQRTPIVQLYERMVSSMEEASALQPRYLAMANSLNAGEQIHSLSAAQETRHRLIKMFEVTDAASKRILAMVQPPSQQQQQKGKKGGGQQQQGDRPVASTRRIQLHKQVRVFASQFLQEHMVSLPGLPDVDKLKRLQAERSRAAEEKANRDRQAAERALEMREMEKIASELHGMTTSDGTSVSPPTSPSKPNSPAGWQPTVTPMVSGADLDQDPLLLQRDLLRGYIEQARKANRFDEVETLQSSLCDIEMEISRNPR